MKFRLILFYIFVSSFLFSANSLKLVLNSGEIIIGESKSLVTEDYYFIKSDILGEMSIPKDEVQSFTILKRIEAEATEQVELVKESQTKLREQYSEIKNSSNREKSSVSENDSKIFIHFEDFGIFSNREIKDLILSDSGGENSVLSNKVFIKT